MDDRLVVGIQAARALARADEVLDRLVASLAEVQMAREQLHHVVARSVQRLGLVGDTAVKIAPPAPQEATVGGVLHERVVERDEIAVAGAIEETACNEMVEHCVEPILVGDAAEQLERNAAADDRRRLQDARRRRRQEVDTSCEHALDRRGQLVRTGAVLLECPSELLDEERVALAALVDALGHGRLGLSEQPGK
jgi:hypothetical protein